MIGTLTPAAAHTEENLITLRFATAVKTIKLDANVATSIDKDTVITKLEAEIRSLQAQLTKANEQHDKNDISDIESKIEAARAIASAHDHDWDKLEQDTAKASRARSDSLHRIAVVEPSDVENHTVPFLANYSEDPHLAFKLVLSMPPDGAERALGSRDDSCLRLSPGCGISPVTAFIRNIEGRLSMKAAQVPNGSSVSRWASVQVNAKQLQDDAIELNHLDTVLFGHSSLFYVFLEPTTQEELESLASRDLDAERIDKGRLHELMLATIGQTRSTNPLEVKLSKDYCKQLQSL